MRLRRFVSHPAITHNLFDITAATMNTSRIFIFFATAMCQIGVAVSERPEVGSGKPVQEANRDLG